jgi:hypothetical protein
MSPEACMKYLADVPDDEIDKITHLNAMKHFRYDPFSVRPREKCTAGALRAEAADVDTSLVSRARGHTSTDDSGIVSISTMVGRADSIVRAGD